MFNPRTRTNAGLHHLEKRIGHDGRGVGDADAGFFEGGDFSRGCPLSAADDGASVAHAAPGRSSGAGDETSDGFAAVDFDPGSGFFFFGAADLADHDDAVRVRIVIEHFDDVEVRGAVDGVAADADACGLADTAASELPHGFVGKRAAAGDDAHVTALVNVTGRDADAAAAV